MAATRASLKFGRMNSLASLGMASPGFGDDDATDAFTDDGGGSVGSGGDRDVAVEDGGEREGDERAAAGAGAGVRRPHHAYNLSLGSTIDVVSVPDIDTPTAARHIGRRNDSVLAELARREAELHLAAEAGQKILEHNKELVRRHQDMQEEVETARETIQGLQEEVTALKEAEEHALRDGMKREERWKLSLREVQREAAEAKTALEHANHRAQHTESELKRRVREAEQERDGALQEARAATARADAAEKLAIELETVCNMARTATEEAQAEAAQAAAQLQEQQALVQQLRSEVAAMAAAADASRGCTVSIAEDEEACGVATPAALPVAAPSSTQSSTHTHGRQRAQSAVALSTPGSHPSASSTRLAADMARLQDRNTELRSQLEEAEAVIDSMRRSSHRHTTSMVSDFDDDEDDGDTTLAAILASNGAYVPSPSARSIGTPRRPPQLATTATVGTQTAEAASFRGTTAPPRPMSSSPHGSYVSPKVCIQKADTVVVAPPRTASWTGRLPCTAAVALGQDPELSAARAAAAAAAARRRARQKSWWSSVTRYVTCCLRRDRLLADRPPQGAQQGWASSAPYHNGDGLA